MTFLLGMEEGPAILGWWHPIQPFRVLPRDPLQYF